MQVHPESTIPLLSLRIEMEMNSVVSPGNSLGELYIFLGCRLRNTVVISIRVIPAVSGALKVVSK
jgi:hypothetical protein